MPYFPSLAAALLLASPLFQCAALPELVDVERPPSHVLGELDISFINEASGLAVSRRFPDRLYHHNDSGGGPYFYVTTFSGAGTRRIEIGGYDDEGEDLEDMAVGACADSQGDCLYFGGIGDNNLRRESLPLLIVEEVETFESRVEALRRIDLRYPDGPHNAEGLGVDPRGAVYVLTKGFDAGRRPPVPSRLYRLPAEQVWAPGSEPRMMEFVGEIDLPALGKQHGDEFATVATAFDISPDGERFLILTRRQAFEFSADLREHRLLAIPFLPIQEAAAYLPDGSGFLYTQEAGAAGQAQIIHVDLSGP